jgi:hypothetical protein
VKSASFMENGSEITVLILEHEDKHTDFALIGKQNGDTYYEARIEKVEIVNKFALPAYTLNKWPLFSRNRTGFVSFPGPGAIWLRNF